MTTYVVTDYDGCDRFTPGKRYRVIPSPYGAFEEPAALIADDNGFEIGVHLKQSSAIGNNDWTVIEEPDTPKTWGEMTDAEKGALLLAHHENRTIQVWDPKDKCWGCCIAPFHSAASAYRVKPEPVVGKVEMYGREVASGGHIFGSMPRDDDTHTLTLPTLDGKLVAGEFANEDGMKVVIEEKK